MNSLLRVIDTAVRPARWNVAMTAAITELHLVGRITDTLRFHRYERSVLIGRHQIAAHAADLIECRRRGIDMARRITGGGALYMAPGVLAWDLLVPRRASREALADASRQTCEAVAAGLARLGLPARYRAPNEIEVGGRRIAGASGYFDGPSLIYQGAILIDVDGEEMAAVLKIPVNRADLHKRLVTVAEVLGTPPDLEVISGAIAASLSDSYRRPIAREEATAGELELADALLSDEYGSDDYVYGAGPDTSDSVVTGRKVSSGGAIEAHIRTHPGRERRIDQIWLTGDFSTTPARAIFDLEAALRGLSVAAASKQAIDLLSKGRVELRGATYFDIADAIAAAGASRQARAPRT